MQVFEITPSTLSDLAGFYQDTDGPSFNALSQMLTKPHVTAYGLRYNDAIAAVLWILLAEDAAEIIDLRVVARYRRLGLATQLLESVMPRLATPARNSMFLDVRETNSAAIALYEGLGFLLESRRRGYYQSSLGREDALVMRKTLESTTVGQP